MIVRVSLLVSLLTLTLINLSAPQPAAAIDWPFFGGQSSGGPQPGSPEWWKKHKNQAELVPGEGYRVPGFEGYFDSKGRPIDAPADEVITKLVADDEPSGLLPGLDPKNHIRNVKAAVGRGPNQQIAEQALAEGKTLFQENSYHKAIKRFELVMDRWPSSAAEAEAMFLLAESYFWQDEYADARDAYNDLVNEHPNTRHLNTVIGREWTIAQYWEKHHFEYQQRSRVTPNLLDETRPLFDTVGQAVKTYESIRLNDPTGPWADDAIMATASIYFRQKRYEDADYQYTLLRQEYPRSEHQFNAHVLGLQAKMRKYQGADYDGAALEEAQDLLKQIRTQFAGRLTDEEKERLRVAQAEVAKGTEQRELRMAEYYDNTGYYGAARQYYARIAQKYGSSPVGEQARARLAQIGGEPAVPEQPMSWLVEWFPQSSERSRLNDLPEIGEASPTRVAENPQDSGETTQR